MKRSDIFTIILIVSIGVIAAFLACSAILGDPDEKSVTFKKIDVISADLSEPDPEVFNTSAINPTVEVYVGRCKDVDRDGKLSKAERVACGDLNVKEAEDEKETENEKEETKKEQKVKRENTVKQNTPAVDNSSNNNRDEEEEEDTEGGEEDNED